MLLLPTSSYRAAAFVQAAAKASIELVVATEETSSLAALSPTSLLTLELDNPAQAAEVAAAFHREHRLAGVLGVDDRTALAAGHIARACGLPHNPIDALEAAGDKYLQRQRLYAAGVAVPRFSLTRLDGRASVGAIGFPAVLKPLDLAASRGVMRVDDERELEAAWPVMKEILAQAASRRPHEILVEQYVPGLEFALEGVLLEGRLHVIALFDKPDPLTGPTFGETIYLTPTRAAPEVAETLTACAQQACSALGLIRGPVHIELRYDRERRQGWLVELAARPIGGRCSSVLRLGSGGNTTLEEYLLGQAVSREGPPPPREKAAAGVLMLSARQAGRYREIAGAEVARRLPWIEEVVVTAPQGLVVRPLPFEATYLGFVFARAPEAISAERALRDAGQVLKIVIE